MAKEDKSAAMQLVSQKFPVVQTGEGGKYEKPGLSELTVVF